MMRCPAAISTSRIVAANSGVPMNTSESGTATACFGNPPPHPSPLRPPMDRGGRRGSWRSAALPSPPFRGEREGPIVERWEGEVGIDLSRLEGAAALGLLQLAQDDAALQRRDVIDEQDAVQMIDLVLQASRQQALRLDFADLVLVVEIAQPDRRRALDIGIMLGQGQAAFARARRLLRPPQDLGVGNAHRLRLLALARDIDDEDALRRPDLRRGEA